MLAILFLAFPGAPSTKLGDSKLAEVGTSSAAAATLHRALALSDWTKTIRRDLHKCPELLYNLDETSAYVRKTLDELKIPYVFPVATNGIVATIGTGSSPCVGLRADSATRHVPHEAILLRPIHP